MKSRLTLFVLCAVLAAGLGVRVVHYLSIRDSAFLSLPEAFTQSDMHATLGWARRIVAGDILSQDTYHPYTLWMQEIAPLETWHQWWGGEEIFQQAPLYPYFVAGVLMVYNSIDAVVLVQLMLGPLQGLIVFLLARRMFGDAVGVIAAALTMFHGPTIFYQGAPLRDWLLPLLEPLGLLLLLRAREQGEARRGWLVAGLVLGVGLLAKKTVLLFLPLVLLWTFWARQTEFRVSMARVVLVLFGFSIGIAPLVTRNVIVGAPALAVSNRTAESFVGGNAADSNAVGFSIPGSMKTILERSGPSTLLLIVNTLATYEGDWVAFFGKQVLKLRALVDPLEIPNNLSYQHGEDISPILRWMVPYSLILPLGLAGFLMAIGRWRGQVLVLLYLAVTVAALMATIILARYRLVLVPILSIYAAHGIVMSVIALRENRRTVPWAFAGIAIVVALLQHTVVPVVEARQDPILAVFPQVYDLSAQVHLRGGRIESALAEMDSLIRRARDAGFRHLEDRTIFKAAHMRVLWAEHLVAHGKSTEAREQLRLIEGVFGLRVDEPETCLRLAMLYRETGDVERSQVFLRRFMEIAADDPRVDEVRGLLESSE